METRPVYFSSVVATPASCHVHDAAAVLAVSKAKKQSHV
jgi:hypothetical protein